MLNDSDKEIITRHGLSPQSVLAQIETFRKGFPFVELLRPCTLGDGIERVSPEASQDYRNEFQRERDKGRASIFIPASGAASRMFKSLETVFFRDREHSDKKLETLKGDPESAAVHEFIQKIDQFPFYTQLKDRMAQTGQDLERMRKEGLYVPILSAVLESEGLGYASKPKGLIAFHYEKGRVKTPFLEHMIEASLYLKDARGLVKMHFTVPEEMKEAIVGHIHEAKAFLENEQTRFYISYSSQKPSTDTVAVNQNNEPFRDKSENLVFRPGGHGALLENLNEIQGDIVFIKNIDNILPDRLKITSVQVQELLGGYLVKKQSRVFTLLKSLTEASSDHTVEEACEFLQKNLGLNTPELDICEKRKWTIDMLNRPIRVCGMVKNEGEPGGGPFWVSSEAGASRQIVEKSQVDAHNERQQKILNSATHFNPVNLVCGLRDFQNQPFNLKDYVDPNAGFISHKSKDGETLKALELPGLWNGAMAFWLTFFVEIPVEVFGPVKEVNDLLREKHRA